MSMKRLADVGAFALAALAVAPGAALAENTTCVNANFLMAGQVKLDAITDTTGQWYKFRMAPGRSYSLMVWAPSTDQSENTVNLFLSPFLKDDCVTPAVGALDTSEAEGSPRAGSYIGYNEQFMPDPLDCLLADGCDYRVLASGSGLTPATGISIQVLLVETTLYIPYWQVVTAAGYDAAPQIRNGNGGDTARVLFTAENAAGTTLCTVDMGVFAGVEIPANGMTSFGLAGTCGITSGFGAARIAHLLPPGYLSANITTFSANSGLSFDAPAYPRMYWSGAH